jgi:hypothetical protein
MKGGAGDLFLIFKDKDNRAIYITTYPKRDIETPTSFILFRMKLHDYCNIKRIHELINLASTMFFETRTGSERFIAIKHLLLAFSKQNEANNGTDRERTRIEDLTDDRDLYIYVQHDSVSIADLISLRYNGHFNKINDLEYNWVYEEPEKVPLTREAIDRAADVKAAEDRVEKAIFVNTQESERIAAKARVDMMDTLETRREKEAEENIKLETAKNVIIELEKLLRASFAYDKELKKNPTYTPANGESIRKIIKIESDLDERKKKLEYLSIIAKWAKDRVEALIIEERK